MTMLAISFVTTAFALAGAAATLIPIVIFLLWRQRRRPQEWGAMRFLLEAYRRHRRRLRVEQFILLAVRCLALLLLGLALARPALETVGLLDAGGSRVVYLVMDDGIASSLEASSDGSAWDAHRTQAIKLVRGLSAGDRVGLVTAARPADLRLHPPSSDHGAVISLLETMTPAQAPTDLGAALSRLEPLLGEHVQQQEEVVVYLMSEFRSGSARLEESLPSLTNELSDANAKGVSLIALPPSVTPVENIQITSIRPARSVVLPGALDASGQITVRLARQGGALAASVTQVRLVGDVVGRLEPRVVRWDPGQTEASCEFRLDLTDQQTLESGLTALIDGDALTADNARHTVLTLRQALRIAIIDRRSFGADTSLDKLSAAEWIRRALQPTETSPLETVVVEPADLDDADLRTEDVAFLTRPELLSDDGWQVVRRFVDRGGLLLLMPPSGLTVHQWTESAETALELPWRLSREVRDFSSPVPLGLEHPPNPLLQMLSSDLKDLSRPVQVMRMLPVETDSSDQVLLLTDGSPLLLTATPQSEAPSRGLIVYLAVAPELEWTNLPGKPLMVPLIQEIVREGVSLIRRRAPIEIARPGPMPVGAGAAALRRPDGFEIRLTRSGRPEVPITDSGVYAVLDEGERTIGALAVNVDPEASRSDVQNHDAVLAWLETSGPWTIADDRDIEAALDPSDRATPVAKWLLLALAACLVLETCLARWFSHGATRSHRRKSMAATVDDDWRGLRPGGVS